MPRSHRDPWRASPPEYSSSLCRLPQQCAYALVLGQGCADPSCALSHRSDRLASDPRRLASAICQSLTFAASVSEPDDTFGRDSRGFADGCHDVPLASAVLWGTRQVMVEALYKGMILTTVDAPFGTNALFCRSGASLRCLLVVRRGGAASTANVGDGPPGQRRWTGAHGQ
jgi:hypothetical protein